MKKIIDSKLYNTETAEEIAGESYGNSGDLSHTFQSLMRTKKGNYFFYVGGGPMSEHAKKLGGNTIAGSSSIWIPDEDEMKTWLSRVDVEKMTELFPNDIEEA